MGDGHPRCTEQEVEGDAMAAGVGEPCSSSCSAPRMGLGLPLRSGNQSLLCKGSLCSPAGQGSPGTRAHKLQFIDTNGFAPLGAGE